MKSSYLRMVAKSRQGTWNVVFLDTMCVSEGRNAFLCLCCFTIWLIIHQPLWAIIFGSPFPLVPLILMRCYRVLPSWIWQLWRTRNWDPENLVNCGAFNCNMGPQTSQWNLFRFFLQLSQRLLSKHWLLLLRNANMLSKIPRKQKWSSSDLDFILQVRDQGREAIVLSGGNCTVL